jgi:hypothetical protein
MTTDRLAQLEAQAATLNAEIAALKAGRAAPPPPPPKDEGARVVPILAERTDGMPSLKELERLYAAVRNLSPWPEALVDRYDDGRPFRAFSVSFRWLMNVPRSDRPNGKVALSYWLDTCRTWLRARNAMTSDLNVNALILACYACGDVAYCPADPQLGVTWEIGILEYGGRPADPAAWRRILTGGASAILPPSSPARRMAPPSPVRVVTGY